MTSIRTPHFNRRQWLGSAGSAFGALLLPRFARAGEPAPKARAAIVLFLQGGLSHYESFDPKPDASSEVRGEFASIATCVPGVRFSEHLPLLAQRLNRFSIVRSTNHPTPDHNQAIHMTLCGCELPGASTDKNNHNVNPSMGAVVAHQRRPSAAKLPGYVAIPHRDQLGRRVHFADAGFLGSAFAPVDSGMLPERADGLYAVPSNLSLNPGLTVARMHERSELLGVFKNASRSTSSCAHGHRPACARGSGAGL